MDTITIDGMTHRLWASTDRDHARRLRGYCQCCDWTASNMTNRQLVAAFTAHHAAM